MSSGFQDVPAVRGAVRAVVRVAVVVGGGPTVRLIAFRRQLLLLLLCPTRGADWGCWAGRTGDCWIDGWMTPRNLGLTPRVVAARLGSVVAVKVPDLRLGVVGSSPPGRSPSSVSQGESRQKNSNQYFVKGHMT